MRLTLLAIVLLVACATGDAAAEAIGHIAKERAGYAAEFGYLFGVGALSLDDPDGPSATEFILQPFALVYTRRLRGNWRHWQELYFQQATFDASADNVGQDVTRFGARVSMQKYLTIGTGHLPRIGAGLDVSRTRYANRHTIDVDGFLARQFPDRSEIDISALVNLSSEWTWSERRSVHARLEYLAPIGGDLASLSASVALLFQY